MAMNIKAVPTVIIMSLLDGVNAPAFLWNSKDIIIIGYLWIQYVFLDVH